MRNFLLWTSVIIIFIGMFYYINQEQSTTDSYDERSKEDAASHRNYDEPRVQVSSYELYKSYDSNSVRAKTLYDNNLVQVTGSPLKVDSAPGGGAIIFLATNSHNQGMGVYAKGGEAFKSEAANIDSTYGSVILLCYTDEFSIKNPILTDCIFDLKTMSEKKARRAEAEAEAEAIREESRQAEAIREESRQAEAEAIREESRQAEAEAIREKARYVELVARKAEAREEAEEENRKIRAKTERERIKAYAAITQSESKSQNYVETCRNVS